MILDANVIIDCQNGLFNLTQIPSSEGRYYLPYIVMSEFLVGHYSSSDPAIKAGTMIYANMLKSTIPFIPFDYKCADVHASLFSYAKASGNNAHDVIIAAIALANNFKVVTRNVKDFNGILGLGIIDTSTL